MTDIRTQFKQTLFDIRACGILVNENKLLVSHEADGSQTLTGGAVKISETTEQTVKREFLEETGLDVSIGSLTAIIENFFTLNNQPYQ
ncbi:NUDIX domain-containing protein [Vagococcus vulneris]|nr:NUDIX domain-containing protein [Vagococcus vulneris]